MSYEKYLVGNKVPQEVELDLGEEKLKIKIRPIPWSKRMQIRSLSTKFNTEGTTFFDWDFYNRECLKYMVIEAPWPRTDDVFLSQINDELGKVLEMLVPMAYGTIENKSLGVDELKKE